MTEIYICEGRCGDHTQISVVTGIIANRGAKDRQPSLWQVGEPDDKIVSGVAGLVNALESGEVPDLKRDRYALLGSLGWRSLERARSSSGLSAHAPVRRLEHLLLECVGRVPRAAGFPRCYRPAILCEPAQRPRLPG